jgi:hypothetical protein
MEEQRRTTGRSPSAGPSVFIPLIILALAAGGWAGFQMTQLLRERDSLAVARFNQEHPIENAKKLREGLDTLAKQTQLLATKGNAGAKLIVDELRKRGITINPESAAAPEKK